MNVLQMLSPFSIITVLLGLTWMTPVTIKPPQLNQGQERIIIKRSWHKDPAKSNEPIKIKAIKVKGAPVALGRKFLADEDWLKGLAVTVSNNSRRAIRFISLDVDCFSPVITAQEPFYTSSLNYGHISPGTTGPQSDEQKSISPGESLDLTVPEEELTSIKASLIELGSSNFQRIELTVRKVIFEDGQMWYAGWFCDSHGRCSSDVQPKASTLNPKPGRLSKMNHKSFITRPSRKTISQLHKLIRGQPLQTSTCVHVSAIRILSINCSTPGCTTEYDDFTPGDDSYEERRVSSINGTCKNSSYQTCINQNGSTKKRFVQRLTACYFDQIADCSGTASASAAADDGLMNNPVEPGIVLV